MKKNIVKFSLTFCFLFLFVLTIVPSFAANDALLEKMERMESRILELEQRLATYEKKEDKSKTKIKKVENKIEEISASLAHTQKKVGSSNLPTLWDGIELGAGATIIYQTTNNANGDSLSQNGEDGGDGSYSFDLSLTKEFDKGTAFILMEAGEGAGVEDELQVFSNVNFDATGGNSNVSVIEGWYEHNFDPLTVTFGKLDSTVYIDGSEYANSETSQFLGRIFRNSAAIEFPGNAAGLRFGLNVFDNIGIEALVIDGNADWENIFEDTFYAGQITVNPQLAGKPGNYRILGWGSGRDHTKWSDASKIQKNSYGFGLSIDQELNDIIGVFGRYAWQNPKVYLNGENFSIEHSYSLGMQISGEPWEREDDIFAIAFGEVFPSNDYKNARTDLNADSEKHIEAYYSYKVNDHLTISPDLQVVINPYGQDAVNGDKTILIGGIRSQVDF